jgi:hypothetical protein
VSATPRPVAVVLDGPLTPAWQQRALANLIASAELEVVEVRLAGELPADAAVRALHALERRLLRLGPDALAPTRVDARPLGPATASEPPGTLVVWLSERPIPAGERRELLHLRHGGLSEPPEQAFRRAVLGGARAVETEILLRRAGETVLLERAVSGVRPFSATLTRNLALWKLSAAVPRAAERLPGFDLPAPAPRSAPPAPSARALIAHAAVTWPRVLLTRLLFRRPWSILLRERAPWATAGWSSDRGLVRWTPGHLYADPFLFEHEGRHHLFCEEIPRGSARGIISHTELHPDGTPARAPETVIEASHHLSYPFVFAHEGELFLIPESSAAGRVELYLAVDFPHGWRREAILLDALDAVDATILAHGDRLWMFVGVAPPDASSLDELHLFWATAPRGPWQPHPRNPIVTDVRCARPAGAIQRWDSRLVRPGQDGSRRYGGAVSFREIDVLSATDYAEHEVARLDPADVPGARATHTYTSDTRFEAIDLRRRELRERLGGGRTRSGSAGT